MLFLQHQPDLMKIEQHHQRNKKLSMNLQVAEEIVLLLGQQYRNSNKLLQDYLKSFKLVTDKESLIVIHSDKKEFKGFSILYFNCTIPRAPAELA